MCTLRMKDRVTDGVDDTELPNALISSLRCSAGQSEEEDATLDKIKAKIKARPNAFFEMEAFLPKKNG